MELIFRDSIICFLYNEQHHSYLISVQRLGTWCSDFLESGTYVLGKLGGIVRDWKQHVKVPLEHAVSAFMS